MINLNALSELYPQRSEVQIQNPLEQKFYQHGRETALLLNTPEGQLLVDQAKSVTLQVVEKVRGKPATLSTASFDGDLAARQQTRSENSQAADKWQLESERQASELLLGIRPLNNLEETVFLDLTHPDRKSHAPTPKEKQQVELFSQLCRSLGTAFDYQNRITNNPASNPAIMYIEPSASSLKFDGTTTEKVRETFKLGWQSVSPIVNALP
jgi:hypothetical protein